MGCKDSKQLIIYDSINSMPHVILYDYISSLPAKAIIMPLKVKVNTKRNDLILHCFIKDNIINYCLYVGDKNKINLYPFENDNIHRLILKDRNKKSTISFLAVNDNKLLITAEIDYCPLYEIYFQEIDDFLINNPAYLLKGKCNIF